MTLSPRARRRAFRHNKRAARDRAATALSLRLARALSLFLFTPVPETIIVNYCEKKKLASIKIFTSFPRASSFRRLAKLPR